MRNIPLTQGKSALVDDEDYLRLIKYKWHYHHTGYAQTAITISKYKTKQIYMHRQIIPVKSGEFIDHIDGNKLNNQKSNLRISTNSENQANKRLQKNNKTGYKGVSIRKDRNKFKAIIYNKGKVIYLGLFDTAIEAALAYNKKAKELYGDYAYLNNVT